MGQVIIPAGKPNIALVGTDRKESILSYALTIHDPVPPEVPAKLAGYGLVVLSDGFHAENLTIRQVAGDHGQAIPLRIDGDRAVVRGCDLLGWQDTVRLEAGRHYLRDCHIEGRVDYIYGGATAVLEGCTAHTKNEGYVTAASTSPDQPRGFVFIDCRLTGIGDDTVYLGRPWRPYASVTYLHCAMDDSIRPIGWHNWKKPENEATARYAEYGTSGPGAAPEARAPWARQLSREEAERITPRSVLGGEDDWNPLMGGRLTTRHPSIQK
jgi:pectinesterase